MGQNNFIKARQKTFKYILGADDVSSCRQKGDGKNEEVYVVFHIKEESSNYALSGIENVDDRGCEVQGPSVGWLDHCTD